MTSLQTREGVPVVAGGRKDVKMVVPVVEEYSNSGVTVGDPGGTVGDPVTMSPPVGNPFVVNDEVVVNKVLKPMVVPGLNGVVERGASVVVVAFSVLMQYEQHLSGVCTTLSSGWHSMHCVTVFTIVPMPSDDSVHS